MMARGREGCKTMANGVRNRFSDKPQTMLRLLSFLSTALRAQADGNFSGSRPRNQAAILPAVTTA